MHNSESETLSCGTLMAGIQRLPALEEPFRYGLWFRGRYSDLQSIPHEAVDATIAQCLVDLQVGANSDLDPAYIFRDSELWLTIKGCWSLQQNHRSYTLHNHWLGIEETLDVDITDPIAGGLSHG